MSLPSRAETVLVKHFANSFRETKLLALLRELDVKTLVVAGMQTHMCVEAAVRAGADLGFDVVVIEDACATRDLKLHDATVPASSVQTAVLAALNGSYARVVMAADILATHQIDPPFNDSGLSGSGWPEAGMTKAAMAGTVVLIVLAAAAAPGNGAGQAGSQRVPRHDAAAVIKLVAVRVIDESGRPVRGLGRGDFVLTDNGARQAITEFESYVLDESGARLSGGADEAAAPRAPLLKRRLFIFIDLQGSDENGAQNAKAAALYFVDTQVRPDDEVGVIGFSPMRGFFVQEYLTSDLDRIRKAIERAKELPPSAGSYLAVGPEDAGGGGKGGGGGRPGDSVQAGGGGVTAGDSGLGSRARDEGSFTSVISSVYVPGTRIFQRGDFVARMFDLAETLKYVPGNKSLVLFSGRDIGPAKSLGRSFAASGTPVFAVNTKNWIMKKAFSRRLSKSTSGPSIP